MAQVALESTTFVFLVLTQSEKFQKNGGYFGFWKILQSNFFQLPLSASHLFWPYGICNKFTSMPQTVQYRKNIEKNGEALSSNHKNLEILCNSTFLSYFSSCDNSCLLAAQNGCTGVQEYDYLESMNSTAEWNYFQGSKNTLCSWLLKHTTKWLFLAVFYHAISVFHVLHDIYVSSDISSFLTHFPTSIPK